MQNKRWLRVMSGIMILLVGLLTIGTAYQSNATTQDSILYPAPGEIISIDGADMHIYCVGEGSPTVIFEAGLGGNYMDWTLVQPAIGDHTRACAYDRAGMGYSDYIGASLNTEATAQRLYQLLGEAQIEPPYILVGHSIGGIHVRSFYELYPETVVGMVLIDSSHENQSQYLPEAPFLVDMLYSVAPMLARVGVVRGLGLAEQNIADHLTPEQAAYVSAMVNQTSFWQALSDEHQMAATDTNQTTAPSSLVDLPLMVISQDVSLIEDSDPDMALLWLDLQGELTALSTNSRDVIAEGAGHYVHYDRPQIVIDSILSILQDVRES